MGDYNYRLYLQSKDASELKNAIEKLEKEAVISKSFFEFDGQNLNPAKGGSCWVSLTTETMLHNYVKAWDKAEYDPLFHGLAMANPGLTISLTIDNLDSYNGKYLKEYYRDMYREIDEDDADLATMLSKKAWLPWDGKQANPVDEKPAEPKLNRAALEAKVKQAKEKANDEPDQDCYNAAWLHGYAGALSDILAMLDEDPAVIREIKVMVYSGVAESVLSNTDEKIDIEIVQIDKDYDDYEQLSEYADKLYNEYKHIPFTSAHFDPEEEGEEERPIQEGDLCIYSYPDEKKNKSKCLVKVLSFLTHPDGPCAKVSFEKVYVDDSGNGYFNFLQRTGNTMNVSVKYLRHVLPDEDV